MSPPLAFSVFYFLFYLMVTVNIAFLPLHFRSLGFSPLQIAVLSSAMSFATVVGAPYFGRRLTQAGHSRSLLLGAIALACTSFAPLFFLQSFSGCLVAYTFYLLANTGIAVVTDTQAVRRGLAGEMSFERVRLWGSVGFVVSTTCFGVLVERFGPDAVVPLGCLCLTAMAAAGILFGRVLGEGGIHVASPAAVPGGAAQIIVEIPRRVWILLAAVFFVWASHGALYVYFSLYVRSLGWSGNELGFAWNIGVGAEIFMFAVYPQIRRRFSPGMVFVVSTIATMIRWAILSSTTVKGWLFISQILHGWSFGLCYLSSIGLLYESLPDAYRSRGQAWLSAWGSGAGSLAGRILFGVLAGQLASAAEYQRLFLYAFGISTGALIVSLNLRPFSPVRLPPPST